MERHDNNHQKNGIAQCPICIFASNFPSAIDIHLKTSHPDYNVTKVVGPSIQEIKVQDCYRVDSLNHDIKIIPKPKAESEMKNCAVTRNEQMDVKHTWEIETGKRLEEQEANCRWHIARFRDAIRCARISIIKHHKDVKLLQLSRAEKKKEITLLVQKTEPLIETIRLAEDLKKKIGDAIHQRRLLEIKLRALQILQIEKKLVAIENENENDNVPFHSMGEVIKELKTARKKMKIEIIALRQQEESYRSSYDEEAVKTSLNELQSQIGKLESDLKKSFQDKSEDDLNELIISKENSVRCYFYLKSHLSDIKLVKMNLALSKTKDGWIEFIDKVVYAKV